MLTTSLLIGLTAAIAALATAAYFIPEAASRPAKPNPRMDTTMWMPGWPHEAPSIPFTVSQAHHVMQRHRKCRRGKCPRKDAAWMTLVDAGRIRPSMPLIGGFR
jgi:hypothetical protein